MEKSEALRKIKKLLRMADPKNGASAGEIDNALGMIDKMMRDNNLQKSQVMVEEEEVVVTESQEKHISSSRQWHKFLVVAIQRLCECQATLRGRTGERWRAYTFIGTPEDVELAHEMFCEFLDVIHTNSRRYYSNPINQRSYCDGYAAELARRAEAIAEQRKKWTGTTAMIFVGKKSIAIKKRTEDMPKARAASMSGRQTEAYYHGKRDGQEAELSMQRKPKKLEGSQA